MSYYKTKISMQKTTPTKSKIKNTTKGYHLQVTMSKIKNDALLKEKVKEKLILVEVVIHNIF